MAKEGKEKKKGSCLKTFFIIVGVLVILGVFVSIIGGSDDGNTESNTATVDVNEDEKEPESNTSAMVDYIASQAKSSANKDASPEKRDEALNFIASTYPDYYKDNETMEKSMYYGYYLEYAYAKNGETNLYANLGMDTYQAVKYVYRGTESIDSDKTQENLRQISESLKELGYTVE